jgi:hypothetical protein
MDNKGFAYTIDAILALIPVMIVLISVSNLAASSESQAQIQSPQKAQDIMNLMVQYREGGGMSVLETISSTLESGNNSEVSVRNAAKIASKFLDEYLPGKKYLFIEETQLNGEILAGDMDRETVDDAATASRNCGNYTFRIYLE